VVRNGVLTLLLVWLVACVPVQTQPLSAEEEYFLEVALYSEFWPFELGVRKWTQDVRVYVWGQQPELEAELERILSELNTLQSSIRLYRVAGPQQSNLRLVLGSAADFFWVEPTSVFNIETNWGLFYHYWNPKYEIEQASVFVDLARNPDPMARRHLLREELTQALGLANDSWRYRESIFYQGWTTTTEFAPIDRQLIRWLYDPRVKAGMGRGEVLGVLGEMRRGSASPTR
jgi:hypothetical protein